MTTLFGGVEAGGTKFVCAVGTGPDDLRNVERFPTTTPDETLRRMVNYFLDRQEEYGEIASVGVAAFGPVDLNPKSATYGYITHTPKPDWSFTDIAGILKHALGVPVGFDTDVNGAALGEWNWGAAQGLNNFIYMTIGTGIGGGAMVNGQLLHGLVHPEMGHMHLPHDHSRDPFPGSCPFHGDCLEGLANGPAMERRWGSRAEMLPPEHPAWALEAEYLGLALANLAVVLSPERIILGGGVMEQAQLFPMVRQKVHNTLNGYVNADALESGLDAYIIPPKLGNRAGILGAIALAKQAETHAHRER